MGLVLGKNVVFQIYDNGGWRLYACARTCSLSVDTSTVETSTTGSGVWASFEGQKHSWSGSADGVVNLDAAGMLTLADLRQRQIAFTKLLINFERTDESGNVYTDQGLILLTNSSDTGDLNDVATFSIAFQGTGPLTQIFTPTQLALSAVRRYEGTAAGGETSIIIPSLIGKDIIDFTKDGIGFSGIITSGTPVDKQVLYDSSTGTFTTLIPFEPNENYYILYQDI